MEVGNRQQFGLPVRQPPGSRRTLALRTMPVAAGIVGHPRRATVVASLDVTTEDSGPAGRDRAHHAALDAAERTIMRLTIGITVAAQDVGNLEGRVVRLEAGASHDPRPGVPSSRRCHLQRQTIERALRRPDRVSGDLRVACR